MDKVISFGEALVDMLSTKIGNNNSDSPEAFIKFPGGAPANVAAAIGKLGGRSYFAGKIGQDMFGDFMHESLEQAQVRTDYILQTDQAKTALAFVSLDDEGERSFEFYRSPSADLLFTAEDFKAEWFTESGIFHYCSNTLTEVNIENATIAGIERAKAAGFTISFDVNLRVNLWPTGRDPFELIWQCIKQSDIIKVCVEELDFLCREQTREQVLKEMLAAGVALILVTDGGNSLNYYTQSANGKITPPKVKMVDSTAAGDAFMGGFLYALAEHNVSEKGLTAVAADIAVLETMLNFGCSCGAYAVTHQGAFTSLATQADLLALKAS